MDVAVAASGSMLYDKLVPHLCGAPRPLAVTLSRPPTAAAPPPNSQQAMQQQQQQALQQRSMAILGRGPLAAAGGGGVLDLPSPESATRSLDPTVADVPAMPAMAGRGCAGRGSFLRRRWSVILERNYAALLHGSWAPR